MQEHVYCGCVQFIVHIIIVKFNAVLTQVKIKL